jgi:hypothetical protein
MNESGFSTDKRKEYSLDPLTNRRLPDNNPDNDPVTPSQKPNVIADDDDQAAYENYQGNVSYESIQAAKKNTRELNQSMDKIGDTQAQIKSTSKPEITAESNLNQIITYNKQQKAKATKAVSNTTQTTSSKNTKPKTTQDTPIKAPAVSTKTEETKLAMPPVSPPPAEPSSSTASK